MTGKPESVALWYFRYGAPDYDLFDDEDAAADAAVSGEDYGQFSVSGVQFADGRLVRKEDWDAYKQAEQQRDADYQRRRAEAEVAPPVPQREIRDPFSGKTLETDADEPSWLGKS